MALDKQKVLDSAQKYLQKGQIDKAIVEYRRVCEADPEDLRSLQKLGDLYARQGSRQEAIATYMRLADLLVARGFANRAVSIYKQVLQLNPLLVPVYVKLSELFKQLGLSKDARIFNQRAIEILQKTGNQDDLLALLRRVVEGDPDDAISRINLAETCLRVGDTAGAVRELEASLPLLREQKLDDLFIRAAERLLYHNPDNIALCKELSQLHLRRREVPRAMKLLLFCRKRDPEDLETIDMLADHFVATGTVSKATLVLMEKVRVHRKRGEDRQAAHTCRKILQIEPGHEEATGILDELGIELSPSPSPAAAVAPVRPSAPEMRVSEAEIPIFEDDPVAEKKRPSRMPSVDQDGVHATEVGQEQGAPAGAGEGAPPGRFDEVAKRYLEEAEVFLKYGLNDKAVDHLREGLDKSETPLALHEKLKDIHLDLGQLDLAVKELFVLAEGWQDADPAAAIHALKEILLINPSQPRAAAMVEAIEAGAMLAESDRYEAVHDGYEAEQEMEISPPPAPIPAAAPLEPMPLVKPVLEGQYQSFLEEETSDVLKPLPEMGDWDSISTEEVSREALAEPPPLPASLAEETLPEEPLDAGDFGEPMRALDAVSLPDFKMEDVDTLETETEEIDAALESIPPSVPPAAPPARPAPPAAPVDDARESDLDALFPALDASPMPPVPVAPPAPPLKPPAPPAARPVAQAAPLPAAKPAPASAPDAKPVAKAAPKPAPMPASRPAPVPKAAAKPAPRPAPAPKAAAKPAPAPRLPPPTTTPPAGAVEAALEEVEFFMQQGLAAEARIFLDDLLVQYPGNRLILDRLAELESPTAGPAKPAAEFTPLFRAPSEPIIAATSIAPSDGSDSQITDEAFDALNAIESIIQDGGSAVDASLGASPTEIDASDARTHHDLGIAYMEMGVFESAVQEFRVASQAQEMEALCYNMIGMCFMKQGKVEEAIKEYKLGLFAKVKSQDQELNLYYDISEAYIKAGDQREAIYYLQNIKKKDPGFKDVKMKLIALSSSYKPSSRSAASVVPEAKPAAKGKAESSKEVDAAFDDLFGDFSGKG